MNGDNYSSRGESVVSSGKHPNADGMLAAKEGDNRRDHQVKTSAFTRTDHFTLTRNSLRAVNEVNEANAANEATGAIAVIVVTAAMTDETDTETEDARDPPTIATAVTATAMAMHMHPAETTGIGSARNDTRAGAVANVEATENGTETAAARAVMPDVMTMAMAGAIAMVSMTNVVAAESAAMTDSLASKNAEALLPRSAVSPRLI